MRNTGILIALLLALVSRISAADLTGFSQAAMASSATTIPRTANKMPARKDLAESARKKFMRAHIDFVAKARRFTPMFEASLLSMPNSSLKGEDGHFNLTQYEMNALLPLPLDRDTFLLVGVLSGARNYDFSASVNGADDDTLYYFGPRIGAGHYLNDRLLVQGYWQPSVYSDFGGNLGRKDWKPWYGSMLAIYRAGANFFWKAGLIFTDALDTGVIPAGGASWIFAPDWRLDILLPRNAEVSFTPNASWLFHGGLEMEAEEFNVRLQSSSGEQQQRGVHVQELRAFLGAMYRFNVNFSSFVKTGATLAGDYDWGLGDGPHYDGMLRPGPFMQAGVGWRF